MNDEHGVTGTIIIVLIIWWLGSLFGWWGKSDADKLRDALQQANDQISYCNQQIQDAKDVDWQDYSTMGNAIESMEYCTEVSDPTK